MSIRRALKEKGATLRDTPPKRGIPEGGFLWGRGQTFMPPRSHQTRVEARLRDRQG
jgi:hypothetical protein